MKVHPLLDLASVMDKVTRLPRRGLVLEGPGRGSGHGSFLENSVGVWWRITYFEIFKSAAVVQRDKHRRTFPLGVA